MHVLFDGTTWVGGGSGFYRNWNTGPVPEPLDLTTSDLSVSVDGPEIAVGQEGKTVTVRYGAQSADACAVDVTMGFDADADGWTDRERTVHVLTDDVGGDSTVRYAVPEITVEYGERATETHPATDALPTVSARVTCLCLPAGYGAFVGEFLAWGLILEEFGHVDWTILDLEGMVSIEQVRWKDATWTASA